MRFLPPSYSSERRSLLEVAAERLQKDFVEALLAHKANVNYQDKDGGTALSRAKEAGEPPGQPMLGAPRMMGIPNFGLGPAPGMGQPPGFNQPGENNSVSKRSTEIVDLLLKAGANPNLQRLSTMTVGRKGSDNSPAIFAKSTNDWNHYTLFELIAGAYSGNGRFSFPDFAHIKIDRLKESDASSHRGNTCGP